MTKPTSEQVTFLAAGSGASQRTVLDKLRDVVSVKDFGAVGDGVADDAAAFTNAVTAAGTRNVFVPGGSYKITGTVTGSFYSDATVTIVTGTVNTINRIGSVLSTTGALTVTGTAATGALTVTGTAATGALTVTGTASVSDNIIIATSGKGIDFSATASGSGTMTSELFSDYEEGTWTPVYSPATGSFTTLTMDVEKATYTKVGRQVTVTAYIRTDNVNATGASGQLSVAGLPFTSGSANASSALVGFAINWSTFPRSGIISSSATKIDLQYRALANGADAGVAVVHMTTGASADQNVLYFSATYFT